MSKETKAELFTRLLVEELETDRAIRRHTLAIRSRSHAEKYKMAFKHFSDSMGPEDSYQFMSNTLQETRTR